jgi:DUF4097 and DUF4098 domain-containing protein YvlB
MKGENVMKTFYRLVFLCAVIFLVAMNIHAQGEEVHKTFGAKQSVRINTVSGNCTVKKGSSDNVIVDLVYDVDPEGAFEPEIRESGNTLRIKERWHGSHSSGHVEWTITVPPTTEIEFSTASGDLSVEGLTHSIKANTASGEITVKNSEGELKISTASGDVTIQDTRGEFDISTASGGIDAVKIQGTMEMSTASGDIDVEDSKGSFELSCASGSVEASNILIEEESSFSTASGKVRVSLAKSSEFDLELSSASGSATLDYHGNPVKGAFEFTARKDRGRIVSPFKFDKEEEFERYDQIYIRKSFTKGGGMPRITISTASGRAIFKE